MSSSLKYILLCFFVSSSFSAKLPSYITPCHKDDPDLNGCLRKQVEVVRPHLADGIPEMGVPPVNPLLIPKLTLDNGGFKATFTDNKLYQLDQFVLDNLDFDLKNNRLEIKLTFPFIYTECQYVVEGRIMVLELNGHGPAKGNFTNAHASLGADLTRVTKKGKEHLKIINSKFDMDLGRPTFWFDRMFGDNKELNDQTMNLINENVDEVLGDLKPAINQVIQHLFHNICEKLVNKFSEDELFP